LNFLNTLSAFLLKHLLLYAMIYEQKLMPTTTPNHHTRLFSLNLGLSLLQTSRTRSLLILPQADQELSEALFSTGSSTALNALATQINQLSNTLPACATSSCVIPVGQKLISLLPRLLNILVSLVIVALVEIVNGLTGLVDSGGLLV
jgi:hypothetical protein